MKFTLLKASCVRIEETSTVFEAFIPLFGGGRSESLDLGQLLLELFYLRLKEELDKLKLRWRFSMLKRRG